MNPNLYQQVKEIVANALELPQIKRRDYLDDACQSDAELRGEVDGLLNQLVEDDFLDQSPIDGIKGQEVEELSGQIGRIKIDKLIALGGMGEVYLGTDMTLNRQVAIKILNQDFLSSQLSRDAFLNEAQVLSSLQHPNICQVYDFFREDQKDVLVLEFIEGKTLRQLFDDKQVINSIDIALQITKALTAAHERGIVHRDLKPDNIMLNQSGQVKVLDFGLARSGLHEQVSVEINSSKHTQVSGTPGYMSPEQARGEKSSTATDMWSFGLILSELFSGQLPFSAQSSSQQLVEQSKHGEVSIPSNISNAETKLITQLVSAGANQRPTARVVLYSLNKIQKRPMRRLRYAIISALLLLTIFSAWKYTTDIQQEKNAALEARADAEDLVGFMLDDLNKQLKSLGKLDILESVANKTMSYYEKRDAQQLQSSQGQAAMVLVKISEVLDDKGRKEEAVELLQRAIEALEELNKVQSNDIVKYRLGTAYLNIGELVKIKGEFKLALAHLTKAVDLGEILTAANENDNPNQLKHLDLYLKSLYNLSDTYRRMDNNDLSLSIIQEALIIAIPAAQKHPALIKNLADFTYKQCSVYIAQNRKDIMLDACLNAMDADKKLFEADRDNIDLHNNYAIDHYLIANIYRLLNDRETALEIVSIGIKHSRELVAWDANNSRLKNELAGALAEKGRLLYELKQFNESQKIFEEAHEIIMPLAQDREEITYLNNLMFSSMYLGKLTLAREIADIIIKRGMKTADIKELLTQLERFENRQKNQLQNSKSDD